MEYMNAILNMYKVIAIDFVICSHFYT